MKQYGILILLVTAAAMVFAGTLDSAKALGIIFSKDNKSLIHCPENATSVTIPDGVTSIRSLAFVECTQLTEVIIPASVSSIGTAAFAGCPKLTGVIIPASVTSIGSEAFAHVRSVKVAGGNKYFANGTAGEVIDIKNKSLIYFPRAFEGSYTIPDGVRSIADGTFDGCSKLTGVTIPDSITSIGDGAFANCSGLSGVTIPRSVTSIGRYAFAHVRSVKVAGGNKYFANGTAGEVIDIKNKRLIYFPRAFEGSYTIPDGVRSIGFRAFDGCSKLTGVNIPDSVIDIDWGAFKGCSSLPGVTVSAETRYSDASFPEGCKVTVRKR